jgi:hypothetical protein
MSNDPINPKHYRHLPAQAIDIIEAAIAKAPSNEAAYLHGQVLKYLLRCWSKKGIEDLRKAKWYLDRLVDQFDQVLVEASGASKTSSNEPTANPQGVLPPSDYRWIKCGETLIGTDEFIHRDGYRDTIASDLVGERVEVGNLFIRKIETPSAPPKRYRDPTPADLKNGPIECEYRDNDDQQWRSGLLVYILSGSMPFLCTEEQLSGQWNQCRIEATE